MADESREHLENVRAQLHEAAGTGDTDAAELADRVGAYLESSEPTAEDHDDLVDRLGDAARRFEMNHPTLSHALQSVIDSLTASGI